MKKAHSHDILSPVVTVISGDVYMELDTGLSKKLVKMDESTLLKCSALFNTLDKDAILCFKPKPKE